MHAKPTLLTPHRRARLIVLARLAFIWTAAVLFNALAPKRRHINQRYGWLDLRGLTDFVCDLVIIRATELAHLPLERLRPKARCFAPPGFRRRAPSSMRRAVRGAHLRRWFNPKDARMRMDRALDALADLDAFVRRFVLKRAKRGLTKCRPLIVARPPAQGFASAAPSAPPAADSS